MATMGCRFSCRLAAVVFDSPTMFATPRRHGLHLIECLREIQLRLEHAGSTPSTVHGGPSVVVRGCRPLTRQGSCRRPALGSLEIPRDFTRGKPSRRNFILHRKKCLTLASQDPGWCVSKTRAERLLIMGLL